MKRLKRGTFCFVLAGSEMSFVLCLIINWGWGGVGVDTDAVQRQEDRWI